MRTTLLIGFGLAGFGVFAAACGEGALPARKVSSLLLSESLAGVDSITCTPGELFCNGNSLWTCTASGTDGYNGQSCASALGADENNPRICSTSFCKAGDAACCRNTRPLCQFTYTEPTLTFSGANYGATGVNGVCTIGPGVDHLVSMGFQQWIKDPINGDVGLGVGVDDLTLFGTTVTLPNSKVSLSEYRGGNECFTWNGTVTLTSGPPSTNVSIDATCANAGSGALPGLHVIATFAGAQ